MAVGIHGRKRRVERPAGIDAADEYRVERHQPAEHEQIPARQVESRECQVARADHQRHDEIAERRRDRWDEEEPHHDDAMHGEQAVVGVGRHQMALRLDEFETDECRCGSADKEKQRDADEIKNGDALVVGREKPRSEAVVFGQVVSSALIAALRFAGERFDVSDDLHDLVFGYLALVGRHQRLIAGGDLRAGLEDRIADVALVGDFDGAVAERHALAVESVKRRRPHRRPGRGSRRSRIGGKDCAPCAASVPFTSCCASHCSNSGCCITTIRPVMRE